MISLDSDELRVAILVPKKRFVCLGSLIWAQRYGPLQVASLVKDAGFHSRLFNEELGVRINPQRIAFDFDIVGISSKTSSIVRAEKLAKEIKEEGKKLGKNIPIILGGEHSSMCGDCRKSKYFDYELSGESEKIFIEILRKINSLRRQLNQNLHVINFSGINTCSSFNNIPDLSIVEGYFETIDNWFFKYCRILWNLINGKIPAISFQGSRGCPYGCSFCPTQRYLQGKNYRRRSAKSSVEYLKRHIEATGIKRVIFEDPTAAIPFDKNSHDFFKSIINSKINMDATLLVRVDLHKDTELLRLMRESGVTNLSIGIESLYEKTRNDFNKTISAELIERSIGVFHDQGFTITGLFIVGCDSDGIDCFTKIEEFIQINGVEKWRITPISQTPELENDFLPAHRVFLWDELNLFGENIEDYLNGEFVTIFPKKIRPSDLQRQIYEFNLNTSTIKNLLNLYLKRRRFQSIVQRVSNNIAQNKIQKEVIKSNFIEVLKEIEKPFYTKQSGHYVLNESLLVARYNNKKSRQGESNKQLLKFSSKKIM